MGKSYKHQTSFTYGGKRYYIKANTKAELERKKIDKMVEVRTQAPVYNSSVTVSEWAEYAIAKYKTNLKPITRDKLVHRVNHCILEEIGSMALSDVRAVHCQQVLNMQKGKSKTQINEVYNMLRFIFGKAIDNDMISADPTRGLAKPVGTRKQRRSLTDDERELIEKVAQKKSKYRLYLLMLYCGCRPSEAAEVRDTDISLTEDMPLLHIRGTKTANSDRYVPVPMDFYRSIQDVHGYLACYENGNKITDANRARVWASFRRDMNIELGAPMYNNKVIEDLVAPDLVPYCLRHDYCSNLARKGIDIRVAQKLMGHSDISLTANIYTHVDLGEVLKAAEKINQ